MAFQMIDLPYETNSLIPYISPETMEIHYNRQYRNYVMTLNNLTLGTRFESLPLEKVILENFKEDNSIYHNAAQAWNHAFFWQCLSPLKHRPSDALAGIIDEEFGSMADFQKEFEMAARDLFGSGWVWLVKKANGTLVIEALADAGNPLTGGHSPILVCDVWEHAYFLDYKNDRESFVKQFWHLVNWTFADNNINAVKKTFREKIRNMNIITTDTTLVY